MFWKRASGALLALAIGVAGCDSDSGGGSEAKAKADEPAGAEETTETTEPQAPAATIEASPVQAPFDMARHRGPDGADRPEADLPLQPGSVTAHWYRSGDLYVVVYAGATGDQLGGCPGNSLAFVDEGGFDFISNAPVVEGACDRHGDELSTPSKGRGPKSCDGLVVYETDIPVAASEGNTLLFASFGWEVGDGTGGLSAAAEPNIPETPEIDYDADSYEVPADFLPGGETTVTC